MKKKSEIIIEYIKSNITKTNVDIAKKLIQDNPEIFKDTNPINLGRRISECRINNNLSKPEEPIHVQLDKKKIKIEDIVEEDRNIINLKKESTEYKAKYSHLLKQNEKLNRLIELNTKIKETPLNKYVIKQDKNIKNEATALALFSDLHVEARIDKMTVNSMNEFNPDIAKFRTLNFFKNLKKLIVKERQDVVLNKLVLGLLGDNIHGFIHEEYHQTNYMTPIEASFYAYELIVNGLNSILEDKTLETIIVVCKVGNHSRTTFKPYTNEEAKMSYEWGMYKNLQKHFENEKRITFVIEESYFTYLDIYNKVIRFHHGHNIQYRGGIGGLTIPLVKFIHRTNEQIKADMDCIGHFHTKMYLRNCLVNGSVCGFDGYALKIGASNEPPVQTFQLIDSKRGFTTNNPILTTE